MLSAWEVRSYYRNADLHIPREWNLGRKHLRIETLNHRFVKLNKFENRINPRELREYCVKYAPLHVYFSVLDWLFPERVGKKYKAGYAVPISGEYVIDIDSYVIHKRHQHRYAGRSGVCYECVEISRNLAVQACESIKEYYSKIAVVFSGRRGFHIHVLDFDLRDWTHYNERRPIKSHEVARLKFGRLLALDTYTFDRHHFTLSVDPMRVMSVPSTLNAETGLICLHIGDRRDLEACSTRTIIEKSNPALYIYDRPVRASWLHHQAARPSAQSYPEPARAVKTCTSAKNRGGEH